MRATYILTGRIRLNTHITKRLFRKPIVQVIVEVEERSTGWTDGGSDPMDYGKDFDVTYWRDAEPHEIGKIGISIDEE